MLGCFVRFGLVLVWWFGLRIGDLCISDLMLVGC